MPLFYLLPSNLTFNRNFKSNFPPTNSKFKNKMILSFNNRTTIQAHALEQEKVRNENSAEVNNLARIQCEHSGIC